MLSRTGGVLSLSSRQYAGRPPSGTGELRPFDARVSQDGALDQVRANELQRAWPAAMGCTPAFPTAPLPADLELMPAPTFPAADGGAPLVFGAPAHLPEADGLEPGRRWDAVIAAQDGFAGVDAPGLVVMPPMPVVTSGTEITDDDLMGWIQPGHYLGGFPADGATRPALAWNAPATPPTSIVVRIADFHLDPPLIYCGVAPSATSWEMDAATFAMLATSSDSQNDVVAMDVSFFNVTAAALGESDDLAFLSITESVQGNAFFQKLPAAAQAAK